MPMAFQKAFRFLNATLRSPVVVPRANIVEKPPRDNLTAADQALALTVMFATFLIPSSWFLCHLEDYKNHSKD